MRGLSAIALLWLVGCSGDGAPPVPSPTPAPTAPEPAAPDPSYQAEIRRTEYGIPHVTAGDWGSLGYGYGYAYARDNFCVAMRAFVHASSRASEFFGTERGNLASDFVLRWLFGTREEFRANYLADSGGRALLLAEGYAAGMNRYLRETGAANLPAGDEGCRDADWVSEVDAVDVWMRMFRILLSGSSDQPIVRRAIFAAAGPDGTATRGFSRSERLELERAVRRNRHAFRTGGLGSNALAVGRGLSQTGKGLLLGNPHRGWSGPDGFHQVHLTLPGEYDVAGAALHGMPWVGIGFNRDLAWTHTTSFAARFTLYELQLNPDDPMQYRYEGEWRNITTEEATIRVRLEDGSLEERTHTFYRSHFGPIVSLSEIIPLLGGWPLPNGSLLTLRDANAPRGTAAIDQYLTMGQAGNLGEFTDALTGIGVPVFHTLAADRHGDAFYGEVSGVPHVTERQRDVCATDLGRLLGIASNQALTVLDGSSRACEWGEDPDSPPDSNLYGYEARPRLVTSDYVGNGNDSYWLSNAERPLTGYPLVFGWLGRENTQQSLRTRIGHLMVRERREASDGLDPAPGFTLDSLKGLMYSNRVYAAEIVLDDVLALCEELGGAGAGTERARRACAVLAHWDRKVDPGSRGAQVFTEFWRRIHRELGSEFGQFIDSRSFWEVDFDPADPLNTPRGIDTSQSGNRELVVEALSGAVQSLEAAGVPLDAPWRDVQFVIRDGVRIPVHGGDPRAGVYGAISAGLGDGRYTPWSGNSYLQAVTWDDECPVADTVLAPSQSSDPESPHFADQTELYSRKEWVRFPYCEAEIEAAQIGETMVVEE